MTLATPAHGLTDVDAFYTPPPLASRVAAALRLGSGERATVADFAAGGGSLLAAVAQRHPTARLFAVDISPIAATKLRDSLPCSRIGVCDFLDADSRNNCEITAPEQRYDAVVLNPPFSYRGNRRTVARLAESTISGSPAAVFVALASEYVDDGQIVAILPRSTLVAERDAPIWAAIQGRWAIRTLAHYGRNAFPGLAAATVLVHMRKRSRSSPRAFRSHTGPVVQRQRPIDVEIVRGCLPMHEVRPSDKGRWLVHTTGLTPSGGRFMRVENSRGRSVRGPAVLLPRVGKPSLWKVQLYERQWPVVLSDCVIALTCRSRTDALEIVARFHARWDEIQKMWTGSCAPYVTVARLKRALVTLEVVAGELHAGTAESSLTADRVG